MKKTLTFYTNMGVLSLFLSLLAFSACTPKPSAEQLRAMDEQRKAGLAAEDLLAKKERERDQLQQQLQSKRNSLQEAEEEKNAVTECIERFN